MNLRPPGPEGAQNEIDGVAGHGIGEQPAEIIRDDSAVDLDALAQNASDATQFGAPVVRELPPDPGPHERLLTVREVASRLGVSPALVYKLCQRDEICSLRIGGVLRFRHHDVEAFVVRVAEPLPVQ